MARNRAGFGCAVFSILSLCGLGTGVAILFDQSRPLDPGQPITIKFDSAVKTSDAFERLQESKVIRNAGASSLMAKLMRLPTKIEAGTYKVRPGDNLEKIVQSLRSPIQHLVRIPEGWWVARVAQKLEESGICKAEDYRKECADFAGDIDPALKLRGRNLEGWLYPDTYDLPVGAGAQKVILRQLKNFANKVLPEIPASVDVRRTLVIASLVELEAAIDADRSKIAGVIENRLKMGMPLQIDASVLYAMQQWKELGPGEVRTVASPYNTYLHKGLPPGPICSPSLKSIQAALNPDSHGYLYYVAKPDRSHFFAVTYDDHLKNIRRARSGGSK